MSSDPEANLPRELATAVELLADDALTPEEERALLRRLDEVPGAWRHCALALLEVRAIRRSLRKLGFGGRTAPLIEETSEAIPAPQGPEPVSSGGVNRPEQLREMLEEGDSFNDLSPQAYSGDRPPSSGAAPAAKDSPWREPRPSIARLLAVGAFAAGVLVGIFTQGIYREVFEHLARPESGPIMVARSDDPATAGRAAQKPEAPEDDRSRPTARPSPAGRAPEATPTRASPAPALGAMVPVMVYLSDSGQTVAIPAFEAEPPSGEMASGAVDPLFGGPSWFPVGQALTKAERLQIERRVEEWLTADGQRVLVPVEEIAVVPASAAFQ